MILTAPITEDQIKEITKPRTEYLWGQPYEVTPCLISEKHGDGLQVIYFQPLATRPNYYILQVDSAVDIDGDEDEGAYGDIFIDLVESENRNRDSYEENESGLLIDIYDETVKPFEFKFPMLSLSCGYSWSRLAPDHTSHKPTKNTTTRPASHGAFLCPSAT